MGFTAGTNSALRQWPGALRRRSKGPRRDTNVLIPDSEVTGASHLTTRQASLSLVLVGLILALFGFTMGSMEVLNAHFMRTMSLTKAQSGGLAASFFAAFLVGPLTYSNWILHRFGFRWNLITGLCLFSLGCFGFFVSARYASFGGFCGGAFFIGSGFATVEGSVFPYVSICGPPRHSEIRTNLAFAIQSTCSVCGLVMSSYVILTPVETKNLPPKVALMPLEWLYLGQGCVTIVLAVAGYFWTFREITDGDMGEQARLISQDSNWIEKPLRKHTQFWIGFASIFAYSGAQASISSYFIAFAMEIKPSYGQPEAARVLAIAQGCFALTRFAAAFVMKYAKPRLVLLYSSTATVVFLSTAIWTTNNVGIAMICLEFVTKSCIFPTMFSLALKGLGQHTKTGSAWLIMAQVGGGFFVPATGAVSDALGSSQTALVVPLSGIIFATVYALFINSLRRRQQFDGIRASTLGLEADQHHDRGAREDSAATILTYGSSGSGSAQIDKKHDYLNQDTLNV